MAMKPKFQATLSGYVLWAWERLLSETGEGNQAELARMVLREWLDQNGERVEREYGISRETWKRETSGNVTAMPAARSRK